MPARYRHSHRTLIASAASGPGARLGLLPVIAAIWLAGCAAGLSKEECAVADWHAIGYEDGLQGRPQTRMAAHRKDCAEHGVTPDLARYRRGWDEGVALYCRPGNAYRQGRAGVDYLGVCPPRLEDPFIEAYASGRRLYNLEDEVGRLERALAAAQRRRDALETDIRETGVALVAPDLSTARRIELLDDLRKLEAAHSELREHEIPELKSRLAHRRADLADLRAAHRY